MKHSLLIGLIIAILFFTPGAYAEFTFHSTSTNACEVIPGHWVGSGKAYNWIIGECLYNGMGAVGMVDSAGKFVLEVFVDKLSGNFVCPEHATTRLTGICTNGVVIIKTDYGDISGHFSQDSGSATGKLSVIPGLSLDVSMQFQRAN